MGGKGFGAKNAAGLSVHGRLWDVRISLCCRKATRVGVFFDRDYIQNSYLHLLSSYYMPNTLPYIGDVIVEVTHNPCFHETNQGGVLIKYLTIND